MRMRAGVGVEHKRYVHLALMLELAKLISYQCKITNLLKKRRLIRSDDASRINACKHMSCVFLPEVPL